MHRQRSRPICGRVGADGVKGDVPEVEQAGEAHDDVQPQCQQNVYPDLLDEYALPVRRKYA